MIHTFNNANSLFHGLWATGEEAFDAYLLIHLLVHDKRNAVKQELCYEVTKTILTLNSKAQKIIY